ncbi:MAG: hypothetical protein N2C14_31040 [Planctomycetales bacterium]
MIRTAAILFLLTAPLCAAEPPVMFHQLDRALLVRSTFPAPGGWKCKIPHLFLIRGKDVYVANCQPEDVTWKPSTGGWTAEYLDRSAGCRRVIEVRKIDEKTVPGECPVPRPLLYLPGPGK